MNARELKDILVAKERSWGADWKLGLEAPGEDVLKVSLSVDVDGTLVENSQIVSGVTSLYAPEECAEAVISEMRKAMLSVMKRKSS